MQDKCTGSMASLDVAGEKVRISNLHDKQIYTCSTDELTKYYVALVENAAETKYNDTVKRLNTMKGKYSDMQRKAKKWRDIANDLKDFACCCGELSLGGDACDEDPGSLDDPNDTGSNDRLPRANLQGRDPEGDEPANLPDKQKQKRSYFDLWSAPNIEIPVPSFNLNLGFAVALQIMAIKFILSLDVILMIRRICIVLRNAAEVVQGFDEEHPEETKIYNENMQRVNVLPDEAAEEKKKHLAASGLARGVNWVANSTNQAGAFVARWPMLSGIFTYIFILAIVGVFVGLLLVSVYIILVPGAVESMGISDLIVQPTRVQLATTNSAIMRNAYYLNTRNAQQQGNAAAQASAAQQDVDLYNQQEKTKIDIHNKKYLALRKQVQLYEPNYPFCANVLQTLLAPDFSSIGDACTFTPIEARIYFEFNVDKYMAEISTTFDVYVVYFRGVIVNTLYCIGGIIAFFLVMSIIMQVILMMLKKVHAVQVRRKIWYVEDENVRKIESVSDEEHDSEEDELLKKSAALYGDTYAKKFREVFGLLKQCKRDYTPINTKSKEPGNSSAVPKKELQAENAIEMEEANSSKYATKAGSGKTPKPKVDGATLKSGKAEASPKTKKTGDKPVDDPKGKSSPKAAPKEDNEENDTEDTQHTTTRDKVHHLNILCNTIVALLEWLSYNYQVFDNKVLDAKRNEIARIPKRQNVYEHVLEAEELIMTTIQQMVRKKASGKSNQTIDVSLNSI